MILAIAALGWVVHYGEFSIERDNVELYPDTAGQSAGIIAVTVR
jgi:hypothetical protein